MEQRLHLAEQELIRLNNVINDLRNKYEQLRVKINSHVERGDIHIQEKRVE